MKRHYRLALACVLALSPLAGSAQQNAGTDPARISVNAPFAEQLIVHEKNMHPEIQKLGLHAVPPGQTQSAIVANNLSEKVGKLSSPSDLQLVSAGTPQAVREDKGQFWDTFVPLHDHDDKIIGFLVMEVPFSTAATQQGAIAKGESIRDEVQKQVPALATLFGPVKGQ